MPFTNRVADPSDVTPIKSFVVRVDSDKYQLNSGGADCVSEAFKIRVVHKRADANMVLEKFDTSAPINDSSKVLVSVPCAVNPEQIQAGTELILYQPEPKKAAKSKDVTAVLEPPAKRGRTGESA